MLYQLATTITPSSHSKKGSIKIKLLQYDKEVANDCVILFLAEVLGCEFVSFSVGSMLPSQVWVRSLAILYQVILIVLARSTHSTMYSAGDVCCTIILTTLHMSEFAMHADRTQFTCSYSAWLSATAILHEYMTLRVIYVCCRDSYQAYHRHPRVWSHLLMHRQASVTSRYQVMMISKPIPWWLPLLV